MNKGQTVEDLVFAVETFKKHGIQIHAMFVVGTDQDPENAATKYAAFATKYGIETVQMLISTPLPGAPLFRELLKEGRIMHFGWNKFDLMHCVTQQLPRHLSPQEIEVQVNEAMREFYSVGYVWRQLRLAPTYFVQERKRRGGSLRVASQVAVMLPILGVYANLSLLWMMIKREVW